MPGEDEIVERGRRIDEALATQLRRSMEINATLRTQLSVAENLISEVEKRFPNWKSFRDLLDCIDCTLHKSGG